MWSDGEPQLSTNFAFDAALDGGHCCVKVDVVESERNHSVWKGEDCETYLHGVCEFHVESESGCGFAVWRFFHTFGLLQIMWINLGEWWLWARLQRPSMCHGRAKKGFGDRTPFQ